CTKGGVAASLDYW
nr:immunoglobulin heavy chain junction region [Macaca mulatta]MOW75397.1 immunoglobulin heavy chain junction region [Macaca mulatta]MOW75670.1 immunoglobulin heavy chain junction region [Macaca mulatta]MOW75750.1 immunoglobulin heavy chain junction region [Macaca mulatta]MOW76126.1 immunoglobulin heavy chain junction region [Macaca mulatta]